MACIERSTPVFLEAVLVSLEHMSYVELVRLSACSKLMRDVIAGVLRCGDRSLARGLLRTVLQEAGAAGHDAQQPYQHFQAVEWLLETADIPPASLAEDNYIDIPRVPASICARLLAAGAHVSDERLMLAARQRVQGVGNWVRIGTGLHPLVEKLYGSFPWPTLGLDQYHSILLDLKTNMAEDLLYALVNSLPDDVNQHAVNMFCDLLRLSPAARQLPAHCCTQLLQFMIDLEAERGRLADWPDYSVMFQRLHHMPGMQQMQAAGAYHLISAAIKCRTEDPLLHYILTVPGITRLTEDNITGLFATVLQSASELSTLRQPPYHLVHALCYAPAVSTIPPDSRVHLVDMLLDLQRCSNHVLDCRHLATHLIQLPGMGQLNTAGVIRLIKTVLQIGGVTDMARLSEGNTVDLLNVVCGLPAANSIEPPVLQELLLLAEGLGGSVRGHLLQLPAAQQLSPAFGQPSTAQQPHMAQQQPAGQQLPAAQR